MGDWLSYHHSITRIGLFYDIAGAFVLAWGLLIIGPTGFRKTTLFWRDVPEVERLAYAKVDTLFGVALIALGFFGQLLGTSDSFNSWFECAVAIISAFLLGVLLLVIVCFVVFRGPLAKKVIVGAGIKNEDL